MVRKFLFLFLALGATTLSATAVDLNQGSQYFEADYADSRFYSQSSYADPSKIDTSQIMFNPTDLSTIRSDSIYFEEVGYFGQQRIFKMPVDENFPSGEQVTFTNVGMVKTDNIFQYVDLVMTIENVDVYLNADNPNLDIVDPAIFFKINYSSYQNDNFVTRTFSNFEIAMQGIEQLDATFEFRYSSSYASENLTTTALSEDLESYFLFTDISNAGAIKFQKEQINSITYNDCKFDSQFNSFGKCEYSTYDSVTAPINQTVENQEIGDRYLNNMNPELTFDNRRLKTYEDETSVTVMDSWNYPPMLITNANEQVDTDNIEVNFNTNPIQISFRAEYDYFGYSKDETDIDKIQLAETRFIISSIHSSVLLPIIDSSYSPENQFAFLNYGSEQAAIDVEFKYYKLDYRQKIDPELLHIATMPQKTYFDYTSEYFKNNGSNPSFGEIAVYGEDKGFKQWQYEKDYYVTNSILTNSIEFNREIRQDEVLIMQYDGDIGSSRSYYNICTNLFYCTKHEF